jgi:hypothetical protein
MSSIGSMSPSDAAAADTVQEVYDIKFKNIERLPLKSRIYQSLKNNPNTAWIARVVKTQYFQYFMKFLMLFLYFLVGSLYYCEKMSWTPGTSVFFTIVTMTTVGKSIFPCFSVAFTFLWCLLFSFYDVGYGYHHPDDDRTRLFTIFFIIFGVYVVYLTVAEVVIEIMNKVMEMIKSKFGKSDIASEYRMIARLIWINIIAILFCLFLGTFVFMGTEGWSFVTALYFAVQTSTTVGYGDLTINNANETYPFLAIYIIFSTVLFAFAINNLNEARTKRKQILKISEMLLLKKDVNFLLDLDRGEGINESDFILAILQHLEIIDDEQDISPWRMVSCLLLALFLAFFSYMPASFFLFLEI